MTYSEGECEFTFAKNVKVLHAKLPAHWYRGYAISLSSSTKIGHFAILPVLQQLGDASKN